MLIFVASRVVGEPVVPEEGTKATAAQETPRPLTNEPAVITSTAEAIPKPTKRNSLFSNLWSKKDSGAISPKDTAPAVGTKEPETTPVSATAPRIEAPINTTSAEPAAVAPAPTTVADAAESSSPIATTSPVASPTTPATDKRRSSFFNALGAKKEKKVEATSDVEGIDAEGRKSNAGKFAGLFRKPSRATPPAHKDTSSAVAPPTVAEGGSTETAPESAVVDQKTPVTASA